jgi:hypothetical protein
VIAAAIPDAMLLPTDEWFAQGTIDVVKRFIIDVLKVK